MVAQKSYKVIRNGVQIGEFPTFDFIKGVHSGYIRQDDLFWTEGMTDSKPVSDLQILEALEPLQLTGEDLCRQLQEMAGDPIPPGSEIFADLSPPLTPTPITDAADERAVGAQLVQQFEPVLEENSSKSIAAKLASIAKGVGTWLLSVVFLLVIVLILIWGGHVAAWLEPWVQALSGLSLLIVVPVSLVLLIFKRTRGHGGLGLYIASWTVGLSVWISCVVYALSVSVFWTIFGILMGGLGIVPVAALMTLIRRDWSGFGSILLMVVITFALRGLGYWIADRSFENYSTEHSHAGQKRRKPFIVILRWLAVLPASILSYFAVSLAMVLFSEMAGDSNHHFADYASALLSPVALIYGGAKIAPSKHSATAIVLTVLHAVVLAGLAGFVAFGVMSGYTAEKMWEPGARATISIIATIVCCIRIIQTDPARSNPVLKLS